MTCSGRIHSVFIPQRIHEGQDNTNVFIERTHENKHTQKGQTAQIAHTHPRLHQAISNLPLEHHCWLPPGPTKHALLVGGGSLRQSIFSFRAGPNPQRPDSAVHDREGPISK